MRKQARKRANTTCCLDFVDEEPACGCYQEESLQCSWDPVVYQSQLGGSTSWIASSSGAMLSSVQPGYGRSVSCFDPMLMNNTGFDDDLASARESTISPSSCDMSKCFPNNDYLWEVSGYRLKHCGGNGDCVTKEEFTYLTPNVVMACGQEQPNTLDIPGEGTIQ